MKLNLKRPLIVFDLETTGTSVNKDRIVEFSYIKVMPDGTENVKTMRFNPEMPIPLEVSLIHGIYDEDIKDAPLFKQKAKELAEEFKGCDFAGFNSNKFDFPLMVEEFLRAGVEFDVENRKFVDAQRIFHMMEQRTLSAAYKFYCNKELVNAHSAEADTIATLEVLKAQIEHYEGLQNDVEFLHNFTKQDKNVDLAGRMIYNNDGKPVINFGKHKGKLVEEVFKTDYGYYDWMMNGDFAEDTKRRLTQIKLQAFKK
ncbi:MAG: 3'-5' exonuclease [Bacteroidia bacterium]|nr:3'-5' exonuclease [Bacteroidia bacterium]MBP9688808.1 3'-5' exonuclease [Bacteroidia bacterium]